MLQIIQNISIKYCIQYVTAYHIMYSHWLALLIQFQYHQKTNNIK